MAIGVALAARTRITYDSDVLADSALVAHLERFGDPPEHEQAAALEVDGLIEVKHKGKWHEAKIVRLDPDGIVYTTDLSGHRRDVAASFVAYPGFDRTWRHHKEGRSAVGDERLAEANQRDVWDDYGLARQVLNHRAWEVRHKNPVLDGESTNWHHIHEQTAKGPNSVENLILISADHNGELSRMYAADGSAVLAGVDVGDEPDMTLRRWMSEHQSDHAACLAAGMEMLDRLGVEPEDSNFDGSDGRKRGRFVHDARYASALRSLNRHGD